MISKFPIIALLLLQVANVGQVVRMWTEHTAAGQSLWSWLCVFFALLLWYKFYKVKTPNEKWAIRSAVLGICFNVFVWLSVIYFQYIVG